MSVSDIQFLKCYFRQRGIELAKGKDAYIFLTTEVGELGDAIMRQEDGWVRNNPDKEVSIADELADVYCMTLAVADSYGVDLNEAFINKLQRTIITMKDFHSGNEENRMVGTTDSFDDLQCEDAYPEGLADWDSDAYNDEPTLYQDTMLDEGVSYAEEFPF